MSKDFKFAISIHSPHAGRDLSRLSLLTKQHISTHSPHVGRDVPWFVLIHPARYFNPLSPCGERPLRDSIDIGEVWFQSTLPMRGETGLKRDIQTFLYVFQSTLPMRGETLWVIGYSDLSLNFNPLSPCGERRQKICSVPWFHYFNPLSPCGERHNFLFAPDSMLYISIHSPHAGRDPQDAFNEVNTVISIHSPHAGRDLDH